MRIVGREIASLQTLTVQQQFYLRPCVIGTSTAKLSTTTIIIIAVCVGGGVLLLVLFFVVIILWCASVFPRVLLSNMSPSMNGKRGDTKVHACMDDDQSV